MKHDTIDGAVALLPALDRCPMPRRMREQYERDRAKVLSVQAAIDQAGLGFAFLPLFIYLPAGIAAAWGIYRVADTLTESSQNAVREVGQEVSNVMRLGTWIGGALLLAVMTGKVRRA